MAVQPAVEKLAGLNADQTASDSDQTGSDTDQTSSDADQTTAATDQSRSDQDQADSDADQKSSDEDQATADRDEAARPDDDQATADAYASSRADREATTRERDDTASRRAATRSERADGEVRRDATAQQRDLQAEARDLAAELRDEAAARIEARLAPRDHSARAALEYATRVRADASATRARAAEDRQRAAADRVQAAADRAAAAHSRGLALAELRQAHVDDLTGAYLRSAGLAALDREIERARRSDGRLVLAFIDVDGLKQTNDRLGHHAGDELLRRVVAALRGTMRSYEPIVRFGGDEFVCALPDVDVDAARGRFDRARLTLVEDDGEGSMTFGLAALEPGDSLDDLIARADDELRQVRAGRR